METKQTLLVVLAVTVAPAVAQTSTLTPARHVANSEVILRFNSPQPVEQIEVYGSTDAGRTWNPATITQTTQAAVQVQAMQEGRNDFFLILYNAAGASSERPQAGTQPHASVVLDTRAPIVQWHDCLVQPPSGGELSVQLRMSILEEHLPKGGVRLYVRNGPTALWRDAGPIDYNPNAILHKLPGELSHLFDLQLVVTDQAGNQTRVQRSSLSAPAPKVEEEPEPADVRRRLDQDVELTPLPTTKAKPELPAGVYELWQSGKRAQKSSHWEVAGARFREALDLDPDNPDVLGDLGWNQVFTKQMDQAETLFGQALENAPDHLKSLEGLALTKVYHHKYDDAHELFRRYIDLDNKSPRMWLHYGDNLQRMGERQMAEEAWERVLDLDSDLQMHRKANERLRVFGSSQRVP